MGFGIFEGIWLNLTGTVVWLTEADFGDKRTIRFLLKRKDDLIYAVMELGLPAGTFSYPVDWDDLRNLQEVLRATRQQLEPSRLEALGRDNEAEMMRLGIIQRVVRWVMDTPLWRKDLVLAGLKLSFRIRRKQDERCEILSWSAEMSLDLRVGTRGLGIMEDEVIATRVALENLGKPD